MSTKPTAKPKSVKEKKEKAPQLSASERLKTVVRRLPPNLPEEVFWQSVQTWVTDDTVSWKAFYVGKLRKRLNKENIPSRAYIAFKDEEQLALFGRAYDGHVFRDKAGNESQAVVEFAPYQKIPSEKKKADARTATIEKDEDYISFLESLNTASASSEPVSLETLIAATQPPPQPKTTPLLEALKAQKDKEAIIRNHAHYKDNAPAAKKEDPKKKPPPAPAVKSPPELSKKAAKKAAAAQKAAALAIAKNASNDAGPSNLTPPTPKAPRSQTRQQPPKPIPAQSSSSVTPTPTSPPASTERRARPVIGLPSRQFEAALTDAGVASSAAAPADRKRGRDKDNSGKDAVKNKGKRKEDNKGGAGSAPIAVPGILHRPDEPPPSVHPAQPLPTPGEASAGPRPPQAPKADHGNVNNVGAGSGRGGGGGGGGGAYRRWRGRGRGGGNRGGS